MRGTLVVRGRRWAGKLTDSLGLELRRQITRAPEIGAAGARALFIVGCQRSGTTMLGRALERNPWVDFYNESDQRAFDHVRIRGRGEVERLLHRTRARVAVFKPLCDSQHVLRLLVEHNDARAVWIYRHPHAVARSSARLWGPHFLHAMRTVAIDPLEAGWYGEGIDRRRRDDVASLLPFATDALSGSALFWLMRNELVFDLELDRDPRVLVVRYERLLDDPESGLRRIGDAVGLPWNARSLQGVDRGRARSAKPLELHPELQRRCDALLERLDALIPSVSSR